MSSLCLSDKNNGADAIGFGVWAMLKLSPQLFLLH